MRGRAVATWAGVAAIAAVPLGLAATSPLLAWRSPVYVAAGLAGVVLLVLALLQPLLIAGYLPGAAGARGRRVHRWIGAGLVVALLVHVGGLWITSPPDMADALLFESPTPFSPFGVVAMWAVFATALLAALRRRLGLRVRTWRLAHTALAVVIVGGGVVHALLIEGTMETVSKAVLCAAVVAATVAVLAKGRMWRLHPTPRKETPLA